MQHHTTTLRNYIQLHKGFYKSLQTHTEPIQNVTTQHNFTTLHTIVQHFDNILQKIK